MWHVYIVLAGTLLLQPQSNDTFTPECKIARSLTPNDLVTYIKSSAGSGEVSTSCVWDAYNFISRLPNQDAIPLLIKLLGQKKPVPLGGEVSESFITPSPYNLYPAVKALYKIGAEAQPAVVEFIVHDPDHNPVAWKNAIYLLDSLQNGELRKSFAALRERRATLRDPTLIARTNAAMQELKRNCSAPGFQERCDAAAR